ncbi:hypothetical protein E2C01_064540 [Portunus trituberculatus]|uniref:Uncharacterized protein n=1 Tax=Portunus trituberculatus TaxID=210409 RepID=A0A5B7HK16_PORTR|nr:hypothetical protein [Portunus trituberculatus]
MGVMPCYNVAPDHLTSEIVCLDIFNSAIMEITEMLCLNGVKLQELSIDWPKCSQQPMNMIEEMQEGLSHLKFLCLTVQSLNIDFPNTKMSKCYDHFDFLAVSGLCFFVTVRLSTLDGDKENTSMV